MDRLLHRGLIAHLAVLAALVGAAGCLAWTPPGGDDDSAGDDDTGDDDTGDDDTGDDDDIVAPQVDPAAQSAVVVLRSFFAGSEDSGGLAAALITDTVLAPSAEEAALEDTVGVALLTAGAPGSSSSVALPPGQYEPQPASTSKQLFLTIGSGPYVLGLTGLGFAGNDGINWSDDVPGTPFVVDLLDAPLGGPREGPPLPTPATLRSERLVGDVLFVHDAEEFTIEPTDAPTTGEPDVVGVIVASGSETRTAAWVPAPGSGVSLRGSELPPGDAGTVYLLRSARLRIEEGGASLLLSHGALTLATLRRLAAQDVFLRPTDPSPPPPAAGSTLVFDQLPPLIPSGEAFAAQVGGVPFPATSDGTTVIVTVDDPGFLPSGWVDVVAPWSGGGAFGRLELRATPPICEAMESGNNNVPSTANPIPGGQVACGAVDPVGDVDVFRIQATLGVTYRFEVWASRIGSPLDAIVAFVDASGNVIVEVDDTFGRDPRLDVTAQASGPLFVSVRPYDGGTGSAGHTYRLATSALPVGP